MLAAFLKKLLMGALDLITTDETPITILQPSSEKKVTKLNWGMFWLERLSTFVKRHLFATPSESTQLVETL